MNLKQENKDLRKKLEIAKNWIKREILSKTRNISISRLWFNSLSEKRSFFEENIEEIAYNKLFEFIWDEKFIFVSKSIIENIISSEILYFSLLQNKNIDWLWIITSYQKAFDLIIEEKITKPFRAYFNSKKVDLILKNDLDEKLLYRVIYKWHILWFWSLYSIINNINSWSSWYYKDIFKEFLDKYLYIKNIIFDKDFIFLYKSLIDLDVFWSKRHLWKIDFEEVNLTRKYFLWNLEEKNSIFYMLINLYDI